MDQASIGCDIDLNLEQSSELFKDDSGEEPGIVGGPQEADEPQSLNDVEIIENVPENVPLIPLEEISECVPENVPESVLKNVPENVSKDLPERVLEIISEKVPENIPNTVGDVHETILESVTEMVSEIVSEKVSEHSEEPEEGEISDDNNESLGNVDTPISPAHEMDEPSGLKTEMSEKSSTIASVRWPERSNGDVVKSGWNWPKEASPFSGKPDKFYQFAWAKGVQGNTKESMIDSPLDEASSVTKGKMGDADSASGSLLKSSSWSGNKDMDLIAESKSGWIVGDQGMKYVSFLRSDDGFIYLQDGGEQSDVKWGKGRGNKGFSERSNMSKNANNKMEEKYRNIPEGRPILDKGYRRRSDSGRYAKDSRKRDFRSARGERNLEMGEREGKRGMLAEIGAIGSDKPARYSKGREINPLDMSFPQSNLKGRRDSDAFDHVYIMSDSLKDKLFAECNELLRNVSVKDAQNSFMTVCKQLRRAVKILRDLNKRVLQFKHSEGYQRKIIALTRDVFSGIRAAYEVWSTPIGRMQHEGTEAFPRLLDLARNRCQSLFTSKQIQELDSIMSSFGCLNKGDYMPNSYSKGLESEKGEDKEWRFGESSCNTSATTQLESDSSTDTSANGRTETEQISTTDAERHLSGIIPANNNIHVVDNTNVAGNIGLGGWISSIPQEQYEAQSYAFPREISATLNPIANHAMNFQESISFSNVNPIANQISTNMTPLGCHAMTFQDGISKSYPTHALGGGAETRVTNIHPREVQVSTIKNNRFVPNIDPVKALTSYHEKFAGKSHTGYTRLPSPTPSDEDDDATVNNQLETSRLNPDTSEIQGNMRKAEVSQSKQQNFPLSNVPQQDSSSINSGNRVSYTELKLFPSSVLPVARVEDMDPDGHQTKLMIAKKSRDPRRRLVNHAFEGDISQPSMSSEGPKKLSTEMIAAKKHEDPIACQNNPSLKGELVSLLTLGTAGVWSSDQGLMPAIPETLTNMDLDDETLRMHADSSGEISQRKRQFELLSQEIPTKRQKPVADAKDGDGLPLVQSVASTDNMKQSFMDDKTSTLRRTQHKLPNASSDSPTDFSKPRMKPRDPRRVLLGSTVERSNNQEISLPVKGNIITPSVMTINPMTHSKAEVSAIDSFVAEGKLISSPKKDETSPLLEGNAPSQDIDSIMNGSRVEDVSCISKPIGIASKVSASNVASNLDLNGSVSLAAPKQSENINHWNNLEPLLEGLDEKRKQAVRQERARRIEEQTRMFVAKKLCLVLDLDHTLLNSAKFAEIEEEWEGKLRVNEMTERAKFGKEGNKRELYRFPHMSMWTKLRPGIWNFLARASQLYELHVYTMGNKAYATEMARLLDPTGVLFAGRVISKGDDGDVSDGDERPPKSKDLDGVLGMESAVVIIDDSARVWPHHRHNLIVVERYMYFPCSRKQFGLPGPSLLEVGHDEREPDGMLASALTVIEKIHYEFFSKPRLHQVDVRDILAKEQRRVLNGCKLIFSRVFPQGEIQPHLHPLWQLAEQFGAICSMAIDESVTHVVAISLGTDKVNWALSTGRFVVRPSWLEASVILYRRANEQDFLIVP